MAWLDVDIPRLRGRFDLPGVPVWPSRLPYSTLSLRRRGDEGWTLRPASEGDDDVDLVGDLVIPCELPSGAFVSLRLGRLDLPRPFAAEDLGVLRSRSDELRLLMLSDVVADGRLGLTTTALRAAATAGFDLHAVTDLAEACCALRQWPRRRSRTDERHPPEVLRGLLDEPRTYREAAGGALAMVDGSPLKTVRHIVTPAAWTSKRLASMLLEAARALQDASICDRLREDLLHVSARCAPTSRRPDVARSAWPLKFRFAWDAATALLTAPRRAAGEGTEMQPLQPAWSLYQDWVGAEIVDRLTLHYGPFTLGGVRGSGPLRPDGERPLLGWASNDWVIDLWITTPIGSRGAAGHLHDAYQAGLAPDFLLVRRERDALDDFGDAGSKRLETVVVDAKRYSGPVGRPGVLGAGTAASEAGKYLWALRSTVEPTVHAVDLVALVSPGGGDEYPEYARTSVLAGRPGNLKALHAFLDQFAP